MNWDDLRIALAVHRHGNLLAASRGLGVAHTTVSRRLKALEDQLGSALFHRTPSGLRPTAAGQALVSAGERVESELIAVEGRVRGHDARLSGALQVSSFPALLDAFPELFGSFADRYPEVQLSVGLTRDTVSLHSGEADVITRLSSTPPETLVGRKVGPVQFAAYASRSLCSALGADAPLERFPWIGRSHGPNLTWFQDWLGANAPGARIVFAMPYEPVHIARAVRSGLGAQILPCFLADHDEELRRIAPLDPMFRLDLWLLTSPDLRTNRRVHAFIEHATKYLLLHRCRLAASSSADVPGESSRPQR